MQNIYGCGNFFNRLILRIDMIVFNFNIYSPFTPVLLKTNLEKLQKFEVVKKKIEI